MPKLCRSYAEAMHSATVNSRCFYLNMIGQRGQQGVSTTVCRTEVPKSIKYCGNVLEFDICPAPCEDHQIIDESIYHIIMTLHVLIPYSYLVGVLA